ncbi:MAG: 50S ribosomal protein L11 methyltransferase, partial [Acetobacteraceae bacterium]
MLERILLTVPEAAVEAYEAALASTCETVGFFRDDATGLWQVEGIRRAGGDAAGLAAALALAEAISGPPLSVTCAVLAPDDWLSRSYAGFPEQLIGRRFAVRGSHVTGPNAPGRITLLLDAGMAFGSGEHGSTRGCLRAMEYVAYRRPRRILDLGTGSGILAMAAVALLHRPT